MSSARKPYLKLKDSIIEFFSAPVRYISESLTKESQFEKPYQDGEYQSMHLDPPNSDIPTGDSGEGVGPNCLQCYLQAFPGHSAECGSNIFTARIYPGQFCSDDFNTFSDCVFTTNLLVGSILEELPGSFGWAISREYIFDPNIEFHVVEATLKDGSGKICTITLEQHCVPCDCENPPGGVLTLDSDSTPDTIAPGGTATIYWTGGCPPFTIEGVGTGYSSLAETVDRSVTISCVSGTCGVDYAFKDVVTITDICGSSFTKILRNTAGQWGAITYDCYNAPGSFQEYLIIEDRRYFLSWSYAGLGAPWTYNGSCDGSEGTKICTGHACNDYAFSVTPYNSIYPDSLCERFINSIFSYCLYFSSFSSTPSDGKTIQNVGYQDWSC